MNKSDDLAPNEELVGAPEQEQYCHNLALELTQTGIWDWYVPTGAIYWNNCHYTLLGYQPGEVEPGYKFWYSRVHPDDVTEVEQKICQALENHQNYEAEYRIIRKDGSVCWVLGKGRGIYEETGQLVRMIGTIVDITNFKTLLITQQFLRERQQQEAALRVNQARQEFLLKLTDVIRSLGDPLEIQENAACLLGEHLGVDGAFYADVVVENGIEYYVIERAYHKMVDSLPLGKSPWKVEIFSLTIMSTRFSLGSVFQSGKTENRLPC